LISRVQGPHLTETTRSGMPICSVRGDARLLSLDI
jgi:hypothetical protein